MTVLHCRPSAVHCEAANRIFTDILSSAQGWRHIEEFGGIERASAEAISNSPDYDRHGSSCPPAGNPISSRFLSLAREVRSPEKAVRFAWPLFWAAVRAEHRLLNEHCASDDIETTLNARLPVLIDSELQMIFNQVGNAPDHCRVHYIDLQPDEEVHGADLGFIIVADYGGGKVFKTVRLQGKRTNGPESFAISANQKTYDEANRITSEPRMGYFLIYPRATGARKYPPPFVVPAETVLENWNPTIPVASWGTDLATFLAFSMAGDGDAGVIADNDVDAVNRLMANDGPDALAVIFLGDPGDRARTLRRIHKHARVTKRRRAAAKKGWRTRKGRGRE